MTAEYQTDADPTDQHSPAPWTWDGDTLRDANGKRIVETDGGFYPPHGRDRALIAKAPRLLELCERALAAWTGEGPGIILDDLRDGIVSARGGE